MHQTTRQESLVSLVRYGFDADTLYIRVDSVRPMRELLASGYEVAFKFLAPEGVRYSVRSDGRRTTGIFFDHRDEVPRWVERGPGSARVSAGTVLEVAMPLKALGGLPAISFFVAVYDALDKTIERHPSHRPIELTVPDERFEAIHWTA